MHNNNPNDYLQEDEIDLKEIFKLLINSKKLIIVTTLIITLLGAIYSFQKKVPLPLYESTALIEIGSNYQYQDKQKKLFEPTKTLINEIIQELTINYIHKQKVNVSINSIKGVNRLIQITSSSASSVKNKNLLNEMIEYVENRHSILLNENKQRITNQLTYEIESLNDKIEFSVSSLLLRISSKIESLNNELPKIDSKIESLNEVIIAEQNNLLLLKSVPELFIQRAAQSPTLNEIIHSYKTQLFDLKAEKIYLSQEKDDLESQLKFLENNDLESVNIFRIFQEKNDLESQLKFFENNDLESEKVFELSQEKDSLELELALQMKQTSTSTQLIGKIVTDTIHLKKDLTIFLSFIFGLFLSIMLVLINYFYKAFKEDQV
jgi:hypothetical protein